MLEVGDRIRIDYMNDDYSGAKYAGREGVVTGIAKDPWGDTAIYGTWGGLALYPSGGDCYTIIEKGGSK